MRAPLFWNQDQLLSRLLTPIGCVYHALARLRRQCVIPHSVSAPVICVGNLVAGGAGKTPVAIALYHLLAPHLSHIAFVSRGYGGSQRLPLRVDADHHPASLVGDEPLLLARTAPTYVGKIRLEVARVAISAGANGLILDDGFQNPSVRKDVSLVVVDGGYAFGNGRMIPAGPLREPVEEGIARADAMILVGEDVHGVSAQIGTRVPIFRAQLHMDTQSLKPPKKLLAFAGIGRPEKFHSGLRQAGCAVVKMVGFADHHTYQESDIHRLIEEAKRHDAELVTTEKDFVRIPASLRAGIRTVPLTLSFDEPDALTSRILSLLHDKKNLV